MGFFASKNDDATTGDEALDCKLCGLPLSSGNFSNDIGLCDGCLINTNSFLKNYFNPSMDKYQALADKEIDPDDKVSYLRDLLDVLYAYKVKYYDNDVDFIDQDIDDLIDSIVDSISKVRI